jgi:NAD(P)H-dependent flavin oxidoreductase YrpB (nitropropane dioxygenase family)
MSIDTQLTRLYGVRHPFVVAGMGFAGMTPPLTVAICEAGGIGSVGIGAMPPPAMRDLIRAVRTRTSAPFNVNLLGVFTTPDHVAVCIEERVPIVSFHWGHPEATVIERLHDAGCHVWEQVGGTLAASRAAADGVDVIVAQGIEAGGHNSADLPTFVQVPTIIDAVRPVPVLAAGGVVDGRGVAAALALGAEGVWVGTRMVATLEANAHDEYKRRLVAASGADTIRTSILGPDMPEFNPYRVLRNRVIQEYLGREAEVPADVSSQPVIGTMNLGGQEVPLRRFNSFPAIPEMDGDFDELAMPAGEGVGLIHGIEPAAAVMEQMMAEAEEILTRLASAVTGR